MIDSPKPHAASSDHELIDNLYKELIENLYQWVYHILNRLDQIENPGMEPLWPERKGKK